MPQASSPTAALKFIKPANLVLTIQQQSNGLCLVHRLKIDPKTQAVSKTGAVSCPHVLLGTTLKIGRQAVQGDVFIEKDNVVFRYNAPNGNEQYRYHSLAPNTTGAKSLVLTADNPSYQHAETAFITATRLNSKRRGLYSPAIAQLLLHVEIQFGCNDDSCLSWADIAALNSACFKLEKSDDTTKPAAIQALQARLVAMAEAHCQTSRQRDLTPAERTCIEQDVAAQIDDKIIPETRRNAVVHKIHNHYLVQLIKQQQLSLSAEQIRTINTFLDAHLNQTDALTQQAINACLSTAGVNVTLSETQAKRVHNAACEAQSLNKLRNPLLVDLILRRCGHGRLDARGLPDTDSMDNAISALNDAQAFGEEGALTQADLKRLLPRIIQEHGTPKDIPMGCTDPQNELAVINAYQRNCALLDKHIKPHYPELAQVLETIIKHNFIQVHSQLGNATQPLLALTMNTDENVLLALRAIQDDVSRGANLYEALTPARCRLLLQGEPIEHTLDFGMPADLSDSDKNRYRRQQAHALAQRYYATLNTFKDKLFNAHKNSDDSYLTFYNSQGYSIKLRVVDRNDGTPPHCLVLQTSEPAHPKAVRALTLLQDSTFDTAEQQHALDAECLVGQPLWDEAKNKWFYLHWDARHQLLGEIDESGYKTVYQFDLTHGVWTTVQDDASLGRMRWPTDTLVFPSRPPLAQRALARIDNNERFTTQAELDAYLAHYAAWCKNIEINCSLVEVEDDKQRPYPSLAHPIHELATTLPSEDVTFITADKCEQLKQTAKVLPHIEQELVDARRQLEDAQARFMTILAASVNANPPNPAHQLALNNAAAIRAVFGRGNAKKTRAGVGQLGFETHIQRIDGLLQTCRSQQKQIKRIISNARIGVQIKSPGAPAHVAVGFGDLDEAPELYEDNEPGQTQERPFEIETSAECKVQVHVSPRRTLAQFPEHAVEHDYLRGFDGAKDFAKGKIPIQIRFNPKNDTAVTGAKVLRDQALLYLRSRGLNPETNLFINEKPFSKSTLADVSSEQLQQQEQTWQANASRQTQQTRAIRRATDALVSVAKTNQKRRHQLEQKRQQAQQQNNNNRAGTKSPAAGG